MNRNNVQSKTRRALDTVKGFAARVGAAGTALVATTGTAMAQSAEFDPATITAKITLYAGYALVILLAFAAAVWGLRAAGIIKGK